MLICPIWPGIILIIWLQFSENQKKFEKVDFSVSNWKFCYVNNTCRYSYYSKSIKRSAFFFQKNNQCFSDYTESFSFFVILIYIWLNFRTLTLEKNWRESSYTSLVFKMLVYYFKNSIKWAKCLSKRELLMRSLAFLILFFCGKVLIGEPYKENIQKWKVFGHFCNLLTDRSI